MDPFPTKGIEYLLVIGYLMVFALFAWFLSRIGRERVAEEAEDPAGAEPLKTPWFSLPEGFLLHRGHTWALPLENKIVKIGMDDFAHRLIGQPSAFRLPEPGHRLEQGQKGWQVQVNGDTLDLLSPVHGEVVEVNEKAVLAPTLASEDPYGQGWLMKVRVPCDRAAMKNLLPRRLANAWIDESIAELGNLVDGQLGPVLQDGGVPVNGFARELAGGRWPEIAARLLLTA